MSRPSSVRRTAVAAGLAALSLAVAAASAQAADPVVTGAGGASMRERPVVQRLVCAQGRAARCAGGQVLKLRGDALADVQQVIFRGASGSADDQVAAPMEASPHRLLVEVPPTAASGVVQVRSADAGVSRRGPRLRVLTPTLATPATVVPGAGTFPIAGKHTFGKAAANVFQGGNGHQGQDVFAACGTPLVAARGGVVQHVAFEGRAGNYIVIALPDGTSEAYMHLAVPATPHEGDSVAAGQPIGVVGDTGDADGCHLHFEEWNAPGWYTGGSPFDPLADLKAWDAVS
jgi:murein DD-endopeptidase MepM/ murein hydrolase activator NlpD